MNPCYREDYAESPYHKEWCKLCGKLYRDHEPKPRNEVKSCAPTESFQTSLTASNPAPAKSNPSPDSGQTFEEWKATQTQQFFGLSGDIHNRGLKEGWNACLASVQPRFDTLKHERDEALDELHQSLIATGEKGEDFDNLPDVIKLLVAQRDDILKTSNELRAQFDAKDAALRELRETLAQNTTELELTRQMLELHETHLKYEHYRKAIGEKRITAARKLIDSFDPMLAAPTKDMKGTQCQD